MGASKSFTALDGGGATRSIREQGVVGPVIALTAHAMQGDRERAIEAGCPDYHTKPVELDKLLVLIEKLLDACHDWEIRPKSP